MDKDKLWKRALTRFHRSYKQKGPKLCWLWTAGLKTDGYGRFACQKPLTPHRVMWEITYGPIPSGMKVLHRCDNKACVNPAHLVLGTSADNANGCVGRGISGEHGPNAKLTVEQVRAIRSRYRPPDRGNVSELAKEFGVSKGAIWNIVAKVTWRN